MKMSKEKRKKGRIYFLCDRTACMKCDPACSHTSNVAHAKNFKPFHDESYANAGFMETEYKHRGGVISKNTAPTEADVDYPIGASWVDVSTARIFILTGIDRKAHWQEARVIGVEQEQPTGGGK